MHTQTATHTQNKKAIADALAEIKFDETVDGVVLTGAAFKDFQAAVAKKSQHLALQKKTVGQCLAKIDRSPLSEYYAAQKQELDTLLEQILVLQSFTDFTRTPTCGDVNEYLRSMAGVRELGFDVSKPYALRALDASHRNALLFSDDDAVCETMKPTSNVGSTLHLAFSGDELVALLAAKIDTIVVNILIAYAKDKTSSKKGVRDGSLTATIVKRLTDYKEFAASAGSSIVQCLPPLQFAVSLVDPEKAEVCDLATAVNHVEQGGEEIKSAIMVFFLGIGSTLLEEANAVLSTREAEFANETEKDKVVADVKDACGINWEPLEATDHLKWEFESLAELQTRITEIKSRKKRVPKCMTPKQLAAIERADVSLSQYMQEMARAYLCRHVCQGLSLCASALSTDGYITTASGETTTASGEAADSTFPTALAKTDLEEKLMPKQLW